MKLHIKLGDEQHDFSLEDESDLLDLVELFPGLRSSLYQGYHDIRDTIKDMASYLSNHHMESWVSEE
jgi:hypothetical protein